MNFINKKQTRNNDWVVIIEDFNGQKSLWDGEDQTSKVTWEIGEHELPKVFKPIQDVLSNFTAVNYLQTCKLFRVSSDHRCKSTLPECSLSTLFQGGKRKSVRLLLKSNVACSINPTFTSTKSSSRQKRHFSSNLSTFPMYVKEKDGKSVLWNGKQFVNKITLNLGDNEMFRTLEELLTDYLAGNYVKINGKAELESSKSRHNSNNILIPISMKDGCGSFFTNAGDCSHFSPSPSIYIQNNGNSCFTSEMDDTEGCSSELTACSSMEIIDMKEINDLPKGSKSPRKKLNLNPTFPMIENKNNRSGEMGCSSSFQLQHQATNFSKGKNGNPWTKSDWKAIRGLVMELELDALRTMSYRNVSEEDRRKLVSELWAVNKALNATDKNVRSVNTHFRKLEKVIARNRNDFVVVSAPRISSSKLLIRCTEAKNRFETKRSCYSNNSKDETCNSKKTKPKRVRLAMDKYKAFSTLNTAEGTPIVETTTDVGNSQSLDQPWSHENLFIAIMLVIFIFMVTGAFFPNHLAELFDFVFANYC